jgi:outer membrane protein assembly factor BamB
MGMSEEDRLRGQEALSSTPDSKPGAARWLTLLFPPAGFLKMWMSPGGFGAKIFGSIFIGFYSVVYLGLIMFALYKAGILHFEMRGAPIPYPTFNPAKPDFDALEEHRKLQSATPVTGSRKGGIYWTEYRGPNRAGVYAEQKLNLQWDSKPPQLKWRQPCGGGYGSFVVAKGVAYSLEQRREDEALVAYEAETGRELWENRWRSHFQEPMGGNGPRTTPQYVDGRLYALGGMGEFRCVDALTGETVWRHDVTTEAKCKVLQFGAAASPLVSGTNVVVLAGEPMEIRNEVAGRAVVAYALEGGEPSWQAVKERAAYSSPVHAELAGVPQMLVFTGKSFIGMDPQAGEVLWRHPWKVSYQNAISQPIVVSSNQVFVSAGYGMGCALLEFSRVEQKWKVEEVWRNKFMKNKLTSSVMHDGHVFGLDEDILVCLDLETGRRAWKDGRYGYGQVLLVEDRLIVLCGNGDLALVKADSSEWIEIARLPGISGKTWNNPAIADGMLLIRNAKEMACFDLTP